MVENEGHQDGSRPPVLVRPAEPARGSYEHLGRALAAIYEGTEREIKDAAARAQGSPLAVAQSAECPIGDVRWRVGCLGSYDRDAYSIPYRLPDGINPINVTGGLAEIRKRIIHNGLSSWRGRVTDGGIILAPSERYQSRGNSSSSREHSQPYHRLILSMGGNKVAALYFSQACRGGNHAEAPEVRQHALAVLGIARDVLGVYAGPAALSA